MFIVHIFAVINGCSSLLDPCWCAVLTPTGSSSEMHNQEENDLLFFSWICPREETVNRSCFPSQSFTKKHFWKLL